MKATHSPLLFILIVTLLVYGLGIVAISLCQIQFSFAIRYFIHPYCRSDSDTFCRNVVLCRKKLGVRKQEVVCITPDRSFLSLSGRGWSLYSDTQFKFPEPGYKHLFGCVG